MRQFCLTFGQLKRFPKGTSAPYISPISIQFFGSMSGRRIVKTVLVRGKVLGFLLHDPGCHVATSKAGLVLTSWLIFIAKARYIF